jgi:Tfp pilus assembly protein PilX
MNANNKYKTKKRREGFILVLTVFTTVMLATLVVGLLNLTAIDLNLVKNHMCSLQAYNIAEAGVADAIDKIQQGTSTTTPWEEYFPASPNKYSVSVAQGPPKVVTSTGLAAIGNFSRTLAVEVKVSSGSPPYKVRINKWEETVQ